MARAEPAPPAKAWSIQPFQRPWAAWELSFSSFWASAMTRLRSLSQRSPSMTSPPLRKGALARAG
eukprot:286683-Pyramimonas_sp.AAC.1